MIDTGELRKAAQVVHSVIEEDVANKLNSAATAIEDLKNFAIWMTGCGYDFCQHEYFCKKRDELLKDQECKC